MTISELLSLDKYISRKLVIKNDLDYSKHEQDIINHNKKFIANKLIELKDYFDNMFNDIDPNIILDEEQRIAILTDEDYNLVVAGAGSGKTTTMMARIKYMTEICGIILETF